VLRQVLATIGMTALVMGLVIPGYCLFITSSQAVRAYAAAYAAIGTELPPITLTCAFFPKSVMIAAWLLSLGLQAWLCACVRPRWWAILIVAAQLGISVVLSVLFIYWHLGSVHLPALKVLYDFF
jgi:predicted membrane-bound spermidine synthase